MKILLLAILLLATPSVFATLGGSVDSVTADSQALRARSMRSVNHAQFTVQEFTYGGTQVREYLNSNGIVFAIAWNGLTHPDLSALLGSYYSDFQTVDRTQLRRRGSRFGKISVNHLVVERGGHMRNVFGRAYDLTLFPSGVTLRDIK